MTPPVVFEHVRLLRPLLGIFVHSLRRAVLGCAVLAVLLMSVGLHVHAHGDHAHGPCADHGSLSLGSILIEDDAPGAPETADPDSCGHCHCPPPSVTAPDSTPLTLHRPVAELGRPGQPVTLPDSPTYPPDPPPVQRV